MQVYFTTYGEHKTKFWMQLHFTAYGEHEKFFLMQVHFTPYGETKFFECKYISLLMVSTKKINASIFHCLW
jgi:hypothetical protein